jgi:hypothetical protein
MSKKCLVEIIQDIAVLKSQGISKIHQFRCRLKIGLVIYKVGRESKVKKIFSGISGQA